MKSCADSTAATLGGLVGGDSILKPSVQLTTKYNVKVSGGLWRKCCCFWVVRSHLKRLCSCCLITHVIMLLSRPAQHSHFSSSPARVSCKATPRQREPPVVLASAAPSVTVSCFFFNRWLYSNCCTVFRAAARRH